MTSTKSLRASMLPSSLSFPTFRSNSSSSSNLNPTPDSEKQRKSLWLKGSLHLPRGRPVAVPAIPSEHLAGAEPTSAPASAAPTAPWNTELSESAPSPVLSPVSPSDPHLARSRTWGVRVSSLIPPLTPEQPDSNPQSPDQRKLVVGRMSPPQTPSPTSHVASEVDDETNSSRSKSVGAYSQDHDVSTIHLDESPRSVATSTVRAVPDLEPPEVPELAFSFSTQPPEALPCVPPAPQTIPAAVTRLETDSPAGARSDWSSNESDSEPQRPSKLQKERPNSRPRSISLRQNTLAEPQSGALMARQTSPAPERRGRGSISAQSPLMLPASGQLTPTSRASSVHDGSRSPTRGRIRRSWLPGGGRSRSNSIETNQGDKAEAWIMSEENKTEYNTSLLKNGEKVPELWNDNGNVLVYLYPPGSGCGPSFKVPDFVVSTSYIFNELIQTELASPASSRARNFGGRDVLSVDDANRATPPLVPPMAEDSNAFRLYLPVAPPTAAAHLTAPGEGAQAELNRLVAIRNLFAFLTGQPLVGTKARPKIFHAFLELSALLQEFGFSNEDGSTFGEAVEMSFSFFSEHMGLADCRHSREKTLETLILGERMRSAELYNEAFAHAAGKYAAILDLRLPLFEQVSPLTRQRLERAHLDLVNRQQNVNENLEQFEFPSLFSGIASSSSIPELKQVRFKTWRNSFNKMRQFVLGYYKLTFGNWPPRASNKKNPFAESGLNRLVLKMLYSDMCALYDLLVDRDNLTSRVIDEVPAISSEPSKMTMSALRNMLSEFDRSRPPVLPPVPFDTPQLPSMTAIHETFDSMSPKDQNRMQKRIKSNELILILNKAYNFDTNNIRLPFLDKFKNFEIREGKGKVTQELADQRIGYWLFLYTVIQSLPMLVVDAPGVKYTEGVEYFLCQPPMGNLPWIEDRQVRKMWFEVSGGGGIVELSTDAVMFSVEGTYHRSHCWLAAKQWEGIEGAEANPPEEPPMSPLQPPRPIFPGEEPALNMPSSGSPGTPSPPPGGPPPGLRPRTLSPARRGNRSSIALGLEPMPLEPPNVFGHPDRRSSLGPRPMSSHMGIRSSSTGNLVGMGSRSGSPALQNKPVPVNSGATFDDILGEKSNNASKSKSTTKKKGRFF